MHTKIFYVVIVLIGISFSGELSFLNLKISPKIVICRFGKKLKTRYIIVDQIKTKNKGLDQIKR
jgi:hypothetical protein